MLNKTALGERIATLGDIAITFGQQCFDEPVFPVAGIEFREIVGVESEHRLGALAGNKWLIGETLEYAHTCIPGNAASICEIADSVEECIGGLSRHLDPVQFRQEIELQLADFFQVDEHAMYRREIDFCPLFSGSGRSFCRIYIFRDRIYNGPV